MADHRLLHGCEDARANFGWAGKKEASEPALNWGTRAGSGAGARVCRHEIRVINGSGFSGCCGDRRATLVYRVMWCSKKLVHVQGKWKEGRERIRANDCVRGLHDRRPFSDSRECDEQVHDRPRLEIGGAVTNHHRGAFDIPPLDRRALAAGCRERRRDIEASIRSV